MARPPRPRASRSVSQDAKDLAFERFSLDQEWQTFVTHEVAKLFHLFKWANAFVLGFIVVVWLSESHDGYHVVVTEHVVPALIAALVAQLGALALAVAKLLTGDRPGPAR